jgi:hypothetical protein
MRARIVDTALSESRPGRDNITGRIGPEHVRDSFTALFVAQIKSDVAQTNLDG